MQHKRLRVLAVSFLLALCRSHGSEGQIFCGPHKFCIQRTSDVVYCFGKSSGCLWGRNDCATDGDCQKYNSESEKYTDGVPCSKISPKHWSIAACPISESGPMICSPHKLCVQKVNGVVYCYGSDNGCRWGHGDCSTSADCSSFSFAASQKYTDNLSCEQYTNANAWPKVACVPRDVGPMTCNSKRFCTQRAGEHVYCYGAESGCLWGRNDCSKNADCGKYSYSTSFKYTDRVPCRHMNAENWAVDACPPSATASLSLTPSKSPPASASPVPVPYVMQYPRLDVRGIPHPWDVAADGGGKGGALVSYWAGCVVVHFATPESPAKIVAGQNTRCHHSGDNGPSTSATLGHLTGIIAYSPSDFLVAEVRPFHVLREVMRVQFMSISYHIIFMPLTVFPSHDSSLNGWCDPHSRRGCAGWGLWRRRACSQVFDKEPTPYSLGCREVRILHRRWACERPKLFLCCYQP